MEDGSGFKIKSENYYGCHIKKGRGDSGSISLHCMRVINGKPGVKPEVRENVWRVIRESGYVPNQAARSLAAQRSQQVPSSS